MAVVLGRRIAVVAPFFGREAAQPEERFAFEFTSQIALRGASVVVMTTCARSAADDWSANYYRAGRDVTERFPIERFKVEPRDRPAYGAAVLALSADAPKSAAADETFLNEGVRSPGLLSHVRRVADAYDAFIFTPYSAGTTLQALPFVAERAIVLPQLDGDPLRFARIIRERLANARAFLLRDETERDALVATLGGGVLPRCRVIGPLHGDPVGWDTALAGIDAVVDNLAALDDGRSRERALAQVAYLYPVVRRQRSMIIAMQQSRFWQIRNAWFALKKKLHFKGEDLLPQIPPETAAAELTAVGDPYFLWRERHALRDADIARLNDVAAVLAYRPSFDVLVDVGRDAAALESTLRTLTGQIWDDWHAHLILPDTAHAATSAVVLAAVGRDPRLSSTTAAVADIVAGCAADFVMAVEPGDLLEADALLACALAANVDGRLDVFYADEDEIDDRGVFRLPRMKPDWSPETLLSRDYIGRPCMLRVATLVRAGGLRSHYGAAMWYDALLRVTEITSHIAHDARVLCHRCPGAQSRASEVRAAIVDAVARRGGNARVVALPAAGPEHFAVRYALRGDERVTIVIPTRDRAELLGACLDSIFTRSTYTPFDVLVVDNASRESATQELLQHWQRREPTRFRVIAADIPFNYSRINNLAVEQTDAEFVLFLNNDTVVITDDWIEGMLESAGRPAIGAVGALLLYPDETVQHGGILLGILGLGGHAHRYLSAQAPGYFGALQAPTNYSAVTAACMMVERAKFVAVGGFDEALSVAFNDVDLCLRLAAAGYRSVYLPYVRLFHFESKTRGGDDTPAKIRRAMDEIAFMRLRWPDVSSRDPFYSPNLTVDAEDFSLRI